MRKIALEEHFTSPDLSSYAHPPGSSMDREGFGRFDVLSPATFTPKPAGTRWYHSHAMAGTDLTRVAYDAAGNSLFFPGNREISKKNREAIEHETGNH